MITICSSSENICMEILTGELCHLGNQERTVRHQHKQCRLQNRKVTNPGELGQVLCAVKDQNVCDCLLLIRVIGNSCAKKRISMPSGSPSRRQSSATAWICWKSHSEPGKRRSTRIRPCSNSVCHSFGWHWKYIAMIVRPSGIIYILQMEMLQTYPLKTMATASLRTLSPKTSAYMFTSTFRSLNIASIVSGSVGDINAPKYNVSKNVKLNTQNYKHNSQHCIIKYGCQSTEWIRDRKRQMHHQPVAQRRRPHFDCPVH